uniref:Uncharacterized protein n=1 Tax=Cannabis sativa TaxID=3483 RepID=A0A803PHZ7_CANSA
MCLPKSRGGLGFRKTKAMNQTFLAKWDWKLLTGCQSLCCKILEAKYLRGQNILKCRAKVTDSWFWKSLVKATEILRRGACKVVSDGKDTRISEDPWITHGQGFYQTTTSNQSQNFTMVSELLTEIDDWDMIKLNGLFNQETVTAILKGGQPSTKGVITRCGPKKEMVNLPVNRHT